MIHSLNPAEVLQYPRQLDNALQLNGCQEAARVGGRSHVFIRSWKCF